MKGTKYLGFVVAAVGLLVIVVAAALPLSLSGEGPTIFHLGMGSDSCGPVAYAAVHHSDNGCMEKARDRLIPAATVGVGVLLLGLVMLVGRDDPVGSRVGVPRRMPVSGRYSSTVR